MLKTLKIPPYPKSKPVTLPKIRTTPKHNKLSLQWEDSNGVGVHEPPTICKELRTRWADHNAHHAW